MLSNGRSMKVRSAETLEPSRSAGMIEMLCATDALNQAPSLDSGSTNNIAPSAPWASKEWIVSALQ